MKNLDLVSTWRKEMSIHVLLIFFTAMISLGGVYFLTFYFVVGPYQFFGNIFILRKGIHHPNTKIIRVIYLIFVSFFFLITALSAIEPNPITTLFLLILLYGSPVLALLYFGISVWDYFSFKKDAARTV